MKFVKAGTLEKLVETLTSDDVELESTYINIFFATYRTFASSQEVLTLILNRYVSASPPRTLVQKQSLVYILY